ncbi:Epoxyqueuosine reductase [bioreactor metagenome]|uniref:Epoxyqueuosine reductase n=1 Tax=bioreactor metagenome TaxID=1076179 RepID=A0A644UGV2_9ZZZZ|nr:hypothetical protein [Methanobrevibacter sp.]MEA4957699.1 hypothetical protein [Methanobrevibacter sp.]
MVLTKEINSFLLNKGANIVGFADLRLLGTNFSENFNFGIVIGLKYSKKAILNNKNGNLNQYYKEFNELNKRLDELAISCADFLEDKGYSSSPQLRNQIKVDDNYSSKLPYKTLATLAGLGGIGKCGLLVTKDFGSAIRIIIVLTNAKLDCGKPIETSSCPYTCNICKNICPGNAISGRVWIKGIERDNFYNANSCSESAKMYANEKLGVNDTICGLCISNCPFTRKSLKY